MQNKSPRFILATCVAASLTCAVFTGCHTEDRTAGRYLDDRMTAHRVESNLHRDPVYKYPDVKVSVFDGIVQLSGFANATQQINSAGELAARAEGVRQVINDIALKPQDNFSPTGSPTGRRYQSDTPRGAIVTPNANINPSATGNTSRNANPGSNNSNNDSGNNNQGNNTSPGNNNNSNSNN